MLFKGFEGLASTPGQLEGISRFRAWIPDISKAPIGVAKRLRRFRNILFGKNVWLSSVHEETGVMLI